MRALLIELEEKYNGYRIAKTMRKMFPNRKYHRFLLDQEHDLMMIIAESFDEEPLTFLHQQEGIRRWCNIPAPQNIDSLIELANLMVPCGECTWPNTYDGCYICGKRLCITCGEFNILGINLCKEHAKGGIHAIMEESHDVFDIYISPRKPIDESLDEQLYDNNVGRGYTREEARAKLRELDAKKKELGVKEFYYTMKIRGFEDLPKCEDENFWGWDTNPDDVEIDPNKVYRLPPLPKGPFKQLEPNRPIETESLERLGEIEEDIGDLLDPPFD